ncbi:MauM/NapG family ferredoxin-type protein [Alcaligenaceae bacterium CGII-47]|nr:MauM/NapG family ferredoxin-type protein [Alcaligenaceae bacterium CGII-47]
MITKGISRRRFVQTGLCGLALGGGIGVSLLRDSSQVWAQTFIRPPGALMGDPFYAACIRCGLCVEACPYETLRLFDYVGSADTGTPYFVAREIPCEMCVDIPCVQACPTGALDPALEDIKYATMGVASLSHPHLCNSYVGAAFCDSCFRACPLQGEAITMKVGATGMGGMFTPTVDPDICTGCGKCEQACIAQPAAIRVSPSHAE